MILILKKYLEKEGNSDQDEEGDLSFQSRAVSAISKWTIAKCL